MEKNKIKKPKTIQITYPAPYSQSWNDDNSTVSTKNNLARKPNPKRPTDTSKAWSQSYAAVKGPDPTAPHLKYGVFSNRRVTSNRYMGGYKAPPINLPVHSPQPRNVPRQNSQEVTNNNNFKKKPIRPDQLAEAPIFVFRTIDKRYTRKLTVSRITHMDIKPWIFIQSPSRCPSPNINVYSPKRKLSPTSRSPK